MGGIDFPTGNPRSECAAHRVCDHHEKCSAESSTLYEQLWTHDWAKWDMHAREVRLWLWI